MPEAYHLDEIDKRILFHLSADARNASAAAIAEDFEVTPATIRNRIKKLEASGVIEGYSTDINFERANGWTRVQFTCTAQGTRRQQRTEDLLEIPGVVEVRELLTGRGNLLVTGVGTDSDDISRIGRGLTELDIEVEDVDTVRDVTRQPYQPFAPDEGERAIAVTDFQSLSGAAEVAEVSVGEAADIAGLTIEEASETGVLEGHLVVSIERGGELLTPRGNTTIRPGDVVTIFGKEAIPPATVQAFESEAHT